MSISDGRALATTYEGRSLVVARVPGTYLETRDNHTSVNFPVTNETDQHTAAAKIEYDFGWGLLNSVTVYQRRRKQTPLRSRWDRGALLRAANGTTTTTRSRKTSTSPRAGDGPIQYVVGAYYFSSEAATTDNASLNALTATPTVLRPGATQYARDRGLCGLCRRDLGSNTRAVPDRRHSLQRRDEEVVRGLSSALARLPTQPVLRRGSIVRQLDAARGGALSARRQQQRLRFVLEGLQERSHQRCLALQHRRSGKNRRV